MPATQSVQAEAVDDPPVASHLPLKPCSVADPSDVNVTFRYPVVELYTVEELTDPESVAMRCDDDSQLHS